MTSLGIMSVSISGLVYQYLQRKDPAEFRSEEKMQIPAILAYYQRSQQQAELFNRYDKKLCETVRSRKVKYF